MGTAGSVVERPVGAGLIDALVAQRKVVARAQAREVVLMLEFADARRGSDERRIGELEAEGRDARYGAGEFAAVEIALAVKASRFSVRQVMAVAGGDSGCF